MENTKLCQTSDSGIYNHIILHIPHSSSALPSCCEGLTVDDRLLIDYFTDELFSPDDDTHITPVVFPLCRIFCDVERLPHDPLEAKGLGISYMDIRTLDSEDKMRKHYDDEHKAFRLYSEHHERMSQLIIEKTSSYGDKVLLIDCHSFSSRPNRLNPNAQETSGIDICIGYNDDESNPRTYVLDTVKNHFLTCGYNVAVNTPFSNSKTFSTPASYHSLMIEVNKRLYMDEDTGERIETFSSLRRDICSLYTRLELR